MRVSKVLLIVVMVLLGDFLVSAEIATALAHNPKGIIL
jgi:hypothetical protein